MPTYLNHLDPLLALKIIVSDSRQQLQESVQEAITGRMLAHPHVVLTYMAEVLPVTQAWLEATAVGGEGREDDDQEGGPEGCSDGGRGGYRHSLEDRQVEEVRL